VVHYYVPPIATDVEDNALDYEEEKDNVMDDTNDIDKFLVLLQGDIPVHALLPRDGEPHIDHSISYIHTSDEFVPSLEAKAAHKEVALQEAKH
jgi:hypothetical protein